MSKVLILRTCDKNLKSYEGFQWPESGPVEAPDWTPEKVCGSGLHGLLWGEGNASLLDWGSDSKWLVAEVEESEIVDLGGKVKFPRCNVIFCGDRIKATELMVLKAPARKKIIGATVAAGNRGTATAGDCGTATAGDRGTATAGESGTATAGYRGTATAGDCGTATAGESGTATAGYRGTATVGDSGTATAGNRGTATAGNRGTATAGESGTATAGESGTATVGDRGTATAGNRGTATAGNRGTATAGESGVISILWYDDIKCKYRVAVGDVGENGIEPNTPYVVKNGKLVKKSKL